MFLRASPRQSLRGGDRGVGFLLSRRVAATRYVGAGKGERAPLGETELEWGRDGCCPALFSNNFLSRLLATSPSIPSSPLFVSPRLLGFVAMILCVRLPKHDGRASEKRLPSRHGNSCAEGCHGASRWLLRNELYAALGASASRRT